MGELLNLKVSQIRENPDALRTVNRKQQDFLELVESIKAKGVLQPLLVRPSDDEAKDGEGRDIYTLVDGLHRYTASLDAGIDEVPVICVISSQEESWENQIVTNSHKVDTKPAEYSKGLKRILGKNPTLTRTELANRLGKSTKWLNDRLSLNTLADKVQALVDEGTICLGNAFALAKLPEAEQDAFIDRAITMPTIEFGPLAQKRASEIRKAAREGAEAKPETFSPVAKFRKLSDINAELEAPQFGPALLSEYGIKDVNEAFSLGLKFAVSLDNASVKKSEDEWKSKQAQKAERAKKRTEESKRKSAEAKAKRGKKLLIEAEEAKKLLEKAGV